MNIYKRIGSLVPERVARFFESELEYAGINIEGKKFAGFVLSFSLGLSFAIAINASVIFGLPFPEAFLLLFALFIGITYYWLSTIAESKGSFVEKILPDALQLIASNIKSGLTTERAFFVSARPEFGPFSVELKNASKRVIAGERLEIVLSDIPRKIKSEVLERTIWLITQGMKSGGQIAELLIQLSDDLRLENSLKEETRANISMYVIMILVSAAIGAPLLFSISSFIVQVLTAQTATLPLTAEQVSQLSARSPVGGFIGVPKIAVTADFVVFFSMVILFITAVFSALTIGVISRGSEKAGIRYIPMLLLVDFALFFLSRNILVEVFGKSFGLV